MTAPTLTGEVAFPRTLQADRWVELRVAGTADDDWVVTEAALHSSLFSSVAATDSNVRVFAGYEARVRVPLGTVRCDLATPEAAATLTLTRDGGATAEVTVQLPTEVLQQIRDDECVEAVAVAVAAPELGKPGSAADAGGTDATASTTVTTTLALHRTDASSDAEVRVTQVRGSVIFGLEAADAAALPLVLARGQTHAELTVVFDASRCDQHAFAESKKTFVFAVWLSIDGGEPVYVELRPGKELKDALQAAFDSCGEQASHDAPGGA